MSGPHVRQARADDAVAAAARVEDPLQQRRAIALTSVIATRTMLALPADALDTVRTLTSTRLDMRPSPRPTLVLNVANLAAPRPLRRVVHIRSIIER